MKWLLLAVIVLPGCGIVTPMTRQESKLSKLQIGETRSDVVKKMGTPDHSRATGSEQVDEYRLFKPGTSVVNAILGIPFLTITWWTPWLGDKFFDSYSIQYVDGKVNHWGRSDEGQQKFTADITVKER